MVEIDSDLEVTSQLDEVRLHIESAASEDISFSLAGENVGTFHSLPLVVGVTPHGALDHPVILTAYGRRQGVDKVSQSARLAYVPADKRLVSLWLGHDCTGVTCSDDGLTCRHGACVSDAVDPASLPIYDKNARPRGGDAAPSNGTGGATGGVRPDGGRSNEADASVDVPRGGGAGGSVPGTGGATGKGGATGGTQGAGSGGAAGGAKSPGGVATGGVRGTGGVTGGPTASGGSATGGTATGGMATGGAAAGGAAGSSCFTAAKALCSSCMENGNSLSKKCSDMIDCMAAKWPCSNNCVTDCLNSVAGSGVVQTCATNDVKMCQ